MMKKVGYVFLFCFVLQGHAFAGAGRESFPSDTSLAKLLHLHIAKFKAIPVESGTDNYYVKLMLALYDGANDMVKAQAAKGSANSLSEQSVLLQQYHDQMRSRYMSLLAVKSRDTPVNPHFKMMADAALQHFSKFEFQRYQASNGLLAALLIEFYENMDQLSVAFVSVGESEQLKQLAWDSIKKQNRLIDLLKVKGIR